MLNRAICFLLVACVVVSLGCAKKHEAPKRKVVVAKFTTTPVTLDGKLDDAAWKSAIAYQLTTGLNKPKDKRAFTERGEAMFAWDDNFFYVGVRFTDSDVVAEGEGDQLHHYRMGDVAELFLKPVDQTWYWELYVTPKGKKTSFWFPGRGRLGLESCYQYKCGLQVAAQVDGTLNNWQDKDKGWTAEMAMPISDLTANGESFGPKANWLVLLARYNYSRYLPWSQLSAITPLGKRPNFHLHERYAVLKLVK